MTDRISFAQAALAAVYASPLMALIMAGAQNWRDGASLDRLIGPVFVGTLLLSIPAAVANLLARGLVGWFGGRLEPSAFHIVVGILAGLLLVMIVAFVTRGTAQIGGGPMSMRTLLTLIMACVCNAGMIYAVWHFGWKSAYD